MKEFEVVAYRDNRGYSPFQSWFDRQDTTVSSRIAALLLRLQDGNLSSAKSVGHGLHELRLFFGPGYRIYFARDGERIILLLGGGTKQRQSRDIASAREVWKQCKEEKQRIPQ